MAEAQLKIGRGGRGRRTEYPCIVCDMKCGVDTIECSSCACWVHRTCVPLTTQQFQELSKDDRPFRCRRCACDGDGTFDYSGSLKRYVTT